MSTPPSRAVSPVLAVLLAALAFSPPLAAQQPSPYAGLESRPIKALSAEEIERYRNGEGMGLAMAAELNHFPGPKHVFELDHGHDQGHTGHAGHPHGG